MRDRMISLKLSDHELRGLKLAAASANKSVSAYLRGKGLSRENPVSIIINTDDLAKAYNELKRQGGNLNQIARSLNKYGGGEGVCAEVSAAIEENRRAVAAVVEELDAIKAMM